MKFLNHKTCSMLLALVMLLSIALPVFAADAETPEQGEQTEAEYSVTLSQTTNQIVRVGGTVSLTVAANKTFNAAEILLKYDHTKVSFDFENYEPQGGNASVTKVVEGENEYVKLIDYGNSTAAYVLEFDVLDTVEATPIAPASVTFTVAEAGFGTIESAANKNLIPAALPEQGLTLEIRPALVSVSYNTSEYYSASSSVEKGADLVIYPELTTGAYYEYQPPVASIEGHEGNVTATAVEGGWKFGAVSGNVTVLSAVRTPKNFGAITYVDIADAPVITNKTTDAVYLSDVVFTVPKDLDPTETESGYKYNVTATVAGQSFTTFSVVVDETNSTYTIPGASVTGAVVITVTRTDFDPTKYTVSLGGEAYKDATFENAAGAGSSVLVDKTGTESVTLNVHVNEGLNTGYNFVVKVDGVEVELDASGKVLIENIDGHTHVEIEKELNVDDATNVVKVGDQEKNYLTMNGQNMWLIQLPNHVKNTETAVYTYAGQNMFWSEDHNNFVCVVISAEKPSLDADQFGLVSVAATPTIETNDWDVNKSGDLDASDAQLIWNMYNNKYNGMDTSADGVTGEKFVLADANHDGLLDTKDAAVIIEQIQAELAKKANQ